MLCAAGPRRTCSRRIITIMYVINGISIKYNANDFFSRSRKQLLTRKAKTRERD